MAVGPRTLTEALAALEPTRHFSDETPPLCPLPPLCLHLWDSLPGNKACRGFGENCSCFTSGHEASCQAGASCGGWQACARWACWALRPRRRPGEGSVDQPFCLPLFSA